jgi:hypothetical protein
MADDDVTSASSSTLKVDGTKYDLNALFGFTVLQDLLRSLSKQQDHQPPLLQHRTTKIRPSAFSYQRGQLQQE